MTVFLRRASKEGCYKTRKAASLWSGRHYWCVTVGAARASKIHIRAARIKAGSGRMTQVYERTLERQTSGYLKEMDVTEITQNVTNVSHTAYVVSTSQKSAPIAGYPGKQPPLHTQRHTLTQSLFTSSFLRGFLLKITHSIFSPTQSVDTEEHAPAVTRTFKN